MTIVTPIVSTVIFTYNGAIEMSIHKKTNKTGNVYQVKYRRSDGTQASKTCRTKREAEAFEAEIKSLKYRGGLPDDRSGRILFKEIAAQFQATKTHNRPNTVRRRTGILDKHLIPALGNKEIRQIRYLDVQKMVTDWIESGLAPRTIHHQTLILRQVFDFAVKNEMITKNPAVGVSLPRVEAKEPRALTNDECHRLLISLPAAYQPFIYTVLATGMRWSEATTLTVSDLNLLKRTLTVRGSKTNAGNRTIALSKSDSQVISRHLAATGRTGANGDEPLFTSPEGKSLHSSNFRQRVFLKALAAAELQGVTFHDLRRTHATALVAAGVDPKAIQQRLGHKDIATTLKFYARPTNQGIAKAAEVMSNFLNVTVTHESARAI